MALSYWSKHWGAYSLFIRPDYIEEFWNYYLDYFNGCDSWTKGYSS